MDITLHILSKTLENYFGIPRRCGNVLTYSSVMGNFTVMPENDKINIWAIGRKYHYNLKYYDAECIFRSIVNILKSQKKACDI